MDIKIMTNSIQKQIESSIQFCSEKQEFFLWNEYLSFSRDVLQHSISDSSSFLAIWLEKQQYFSKTTTPV